MVHLQHNRVVLVNQQHDLVFVMNFHWEFVVVVLNSFGRFATGFCGPGRLLAGLLPKPPSPATDQPGPPITAVYSAQLPNTAGDLQQPPGSVFYTCV